MTYATQVQQRAGEVLRHVTETECPQCGVSLRCLVDMLTYEPQDANHLLAMRLIESCVWCQSLVNEALTRVYAAPERVAA